MKTIFLIIIGLVVGGFMLISDSVFVFQKLSGGAYYE